MNNSIGGPNGLPMNSHLNKAGVISSMNTSLDFNNPNQMLNNSVLNNSTSLQGVAAMTLGFNTNIAT